MKYALPDLPYDYAALEPHLSAEILELHHDKHHAAYVDAANKVLANLAASRENGATDSIAGLERTLAFNVSGHVLHSIYWTNMTPDGGGRPEGELAAAIDDAFGSFDHLRQQLTAVTTTVQGSGWGALAWDPYRGALLVEQIHDHHSNIVQAATPLLVIDAWEHAYYLQYKNVKADYVKAFWNIVAWDDVAARFHMARAAHLSYAN
jgi:superoxide dismutase, Fe-Mn family